MAEYPYPLAACKYCPLLGRPSFNDQVSTLEAEIERMRAALLRITRTGGDAVAIKFIHQIANEALEGKDG